MYMRICIYMYIFGISVVSCEASAGIWHTAHARLSEGTRGSYIYIYVCTFVNIYMHMYIHTKSMYTCLYICIYIKR